jgi:hypothetical protein
VTSALSINDRLDQEGVMGYPSLNIVNTDSRRPGRDYGIPFENSPCHQ